MGLLRGLEPIAPWGGEELNPNSEVRTTKAEPRPKLESRNPGAEPNCFLATDHRATPSDFGLRTRFGFWTSAFGLNLPAVSGLNHSESSP